MSDLKAGRELDALISEKIMGYRAFQILVNPDFPPSGFTWVEANRQSKSAQEPWRLPNYSTSFEAASAVWSKIAHRADVLEFTLSVSAGTDGEEWLARVLAVESQNEIAELTADTGPLAICLAALTVVE